LVQVLAIFLRVRLRAFWVRISIPFSGCGKAVRRLVLLRILILEVL
jgi:hypothetical protein